MKLLVAGGGTGGHLFPGIAVAEEFLARSPENEVLFVGTRNGIEARVLPERKLPHEFIEVAGLKGLGFVSKLKNLMKLPLAFAGSLQIVRRFQPDIVLGVGGYASGPVVLAARLLGRFTAVQEQNSRAGFTNRILGRIVRRVFLGFEGARAQFPVRKAVITGNPIRSDIRRRASSSKALPEQNSVVVLGGSQGAKFLNERMPPVWKRLPAGLTGWVHQCGRGNLAATEKLYAGEPAGAKAVEFVDDMASLIESATLVVSRSGASTVAEIAAFGRPALFIPFPFATDDHQTMNARDCVAGGGALLVPQGEATEEKLSKEIVSLLGDRQRLLVMSEAMRRFGHPDAAKEIVDICLSDLGRNGGQPHTEGRKAA